MAKLDRKKAEQVIAKLFESARKDPKFRNEIIKNFSDEPISATVSLFRAKGEKTSAKIIKLFATSLLLAMRPIGDLSKLLQSIKKPSLQKEVIEVTAIGSLIPALVELAVAGFQPAPPEGCLDALQELAAANAALTIATALFVACMASHAVDIEVGAIVPEACSPEHSNFLQAIARRDAALAAVASQCSPF